MSEEQQRDDYGRPRTIKGWIAPIRCPQPKTQIIQPANWSAQVRESACDQPVARDATGEAKP